MAKKKLIFVFPPHLIGQAVTYQLVKKFGLMINILKARIIPKEQGRLVVEVSGTKKNLDAGLAFLGELGIDVQPLAQDVRWHEDRCIECTACTSLCPTGALSVTRPDMRVSFNHEKCIACELCVSICPYEAIEIVF
ncbi:MAG: 4Fe-4S binding protein [Syntrophobacteraceae bacterium]